MGIKRGVRRFGAAAGFLVSALCASTLWGGQAVAQELGIDDPALLSVGIGYFDFDDDDGAGDFRLEYRSDQKLWIFKPWGGVEATSDGGVGAFAGFLVDIHLGQRFVLTPSTSVGLWAHGDGKDLGSAVQFRSALELAYRFEDRSRLGLAVSHISNAGLDSRNPGANIATVYYSMPMGRLFN